MALGQLRLVVPLPAKCRLAAVEGRVTFQFEHPDRSVADNVRKAAKAEFDRAIGEVSETGFEVHGTVRNVRRRLKRVRSLLRLIRPAFRDYAAENAALRDIGAEVGELRDAMALIEAADRLGRGAAGEVAATVARLRTVLVSQAVARDAALDREALLTDLRVKLRDARVRSELWELRGGGQRALVPGFVETYRRARRDYARAKVGQNPARFHEWRKAVKHHASQLSVLRGLVPAFADARLKQAKRLAATLGDLQNLSILEAALRARPNLADATDRAVLLALCTADSDRQSRKALKLGGPLFEERPKLVATRWRAYRRDWRAARAMR